MHLNVAHVPSKLVPPPSPTPPWYWLRSGLDLVLSWGLVLSDVRVCTLPDCQCFHVKRSSKVLFFARTESGGTQKEEEEIDNRPKTKGSTNVGLFTRSCGSEKSTNVGLLWVRPPHCRIVIDPTRQMVSVKSPES